MGGGSEWCLMVVMGGDWSWLRWEVLVCWWLKVVVDSGAAG